MNENNGNDEPIILGELRKQKSSKPIFVLFVFIVLIGIAFALPYIQDYIADPNTFLGRIYNTFLGEKDPDADKIIITNSTIHSLDTKTAIPFDMILLTNVTLKDNEIIYTIKNRTGDLNLDEETLYLEIYGTSNNLLRRIKLTGVITPQEETKSFVLTNFRFNPGLNYLGRIHRLTDEDYDEVTLTGPNLTCTKNTESYIYTFNNYLLKSVRYNFTYIVNEDLSSYLNQLNYYQSLATKINELPSCTAKAIETDQGLEFTAKIDLTKMSINDLGEYINYNYYALDKTAKQVNYEMIAKGFDCK